jgi:hypothetical protein
MERGVSTDGWRLSEKSIDDLSQDDQKLLEFVQSWLTKSAEEGKMIIGGFFPRNVMRDAKGALRVVDFTMAPKNISFIEDLQTTLGAWSDGNPNVYTFLSSEMPEDVKKFLSA